MTTYRIAETTKTGTVIRTDLPVFNNLAKAEMFISGQLFSVRRFYAAPMEVSAK